MIRQPSQNTQFSSYMFTSNPIIDGIHGSMPTMALEIALEATPQCGNRDACIKTHRNWLPCWQISLIRQDRHVSNSFSSITTIQVSLVWHTVIVVSSTGRDQTGHFQQHKRDESMLHRCKLCTKDEKTVPRTVTMAHPMAPALEI